MKLVTFALSTTDEPFEWEASAHVIDTVQVLQTSDHLHDWKYAAQHFRSRRPDIMKHFGNGKVSIHTL